MIDFNFVSPTKIFFGREKEKQIGDICEEFSFKNVLVVIGKSSVKKSGLLDLVFSKLKEKKIQYTLLEGVRPNPEISLCKKGIEIARENNIDSILAIGGGSVIDTAKNIAAGVYYDGDSFDFNTHKFSPTRALPIGVILTIAAAGSELSNSCVIQNDSINCKSGFNSDLVRPVFAVENPELTYSVDKYQTGVGIVDIMMHTLERYLQDSSDNELADGFAEGLLKVVVKAGYVAINKPNDYEARATLMLGSSYSHNGLTSIGKRFGMPVHQLEHALSGVYPNVSHGAGLAVLYPAWAKYYLVYDFKKFATLGRRVFDIVGEDDLEVGRKFIEELENYFRYLGVPLTYKDLGLSNVDIELLTNVFSQGKTREVYHREKPMNYEVAKEIFKMVKEG
ncbi:MAG: iron-containing alcohol dehydrogenase [Bacilli bacterium]|nr:iron-containing alcohol dehydrogenase [Bacilli bacterium]